ncbi:hypothetical protein HDA40_005537 [Hamadaea flava]|uniref:Helix-turn-helix domain-containing protein n=1 Tax=Hamadaea flava TaxID=1742688 RepID=A0ABV8M1G1_9ACTN|nr:hypothetical protein [Hamadaea flava]MCP2327030.1 hypothetical protein [Hamadaea flava]
MALDVDPETITDKASLGAQLSALHSRRNRAIRLLSEQSGYSPNQVRNLIRGANVPRDTDQFAGLVRAMGADASVVDAFVRAVHRIRAANADRSAAPAEPDSAEPELTPPSHEYPALVVAEDPWGDPGMAGVVEDRVRRLHEAYEEGANDPKSVALPIPKTRMERQKRRATIGSLVVALLLTTTAVWIWSVIEEPQPTAQPPAAWPTGIFDDHPLRPTTSLTSASTPTTSGPTSAGPSRSISPTTASTEKSRPAVNVTTGAPAQQSTPTSGNAGQNPPASPVWHYPISVSATEGVWERVAPNTGATAVASRWPGDVLEIVCQINNGDWDGTNYNPSNRTQQFRTWDKLSNGRWIYDFWVDTPPVAADGYSPGIAHC